MNYISANSPKWRTRNTISLNVVFEGQDPARPLIVTPTQRTAGDINQNISSSSTETIVIRT